MFVILLTAILAMAAGEPTNPPYTITRLNNTGIVFENLGELWLYHNTWSILTEIDLSDLEEQIKIAENAEHLVLQLCIDNSTKTSTCPIQQKHIHAIINNIKRRTEIIHELITRKRVSRSIFDGIGSAMHYLFGTMDQNNEQEIYSKLGELQDKEQALLELEERQISVVNNTLSKIQKPISIMMDRQKQLGHQIDNLQNVADGLAKSQMRQEIISSILLQVIEISDRQHTLLNIIMAGKNDKIHPLLISPNTLITEYQKTKSICINCLPMLEQTSRVLSHQLQNKLLVRINLPIFNLPPLQYLKIWCYPIPTHGGHSVVANIAYSHTAINFKTQKFALFKLRESQNFIRITKNTNSKSFVGQLRVPLNQATTTEECVMRMLINPFNDQIQCPTKILTHPKDILIQMQRPNTWLLSIQTIRLLQIHCPDETITQRVEGNNILTVERNCQVQIGEQTLHYQGPAGHPLKIIQSLSLPRIDPYLQNLNLTNIKQYHTSQNSKATQLIIGPDANEIIHQSTLSLQEIQEELEKVNKKATPINPHVLHITSISITSLVILGIIIYIVLKVTPVLMTKCNNRKQTNQNTGIELQQTPTAERSAEVGTSEATPKPLSRSLTLPKTASLQLVR